MVGRNKPARRSLRGPDSEGRKARRLPVEQASRFDLVINRKTASALGVTIPLPLLQRAHRVIE